jgi:5-methylcytosine-specific restriction endonuclease McrA
MHRERYRELHRIYEAAHREEKRERSRAHYAAHPEKYKGRGNAWKKAHPERKRELERAWNATHREAIRAKDARQRSRKLAAEGRFTAHDVANLYEKQCDCCRWCSVPLNGKYHIDHIIPLSRYGTNWPANLALTCELCNLRKGDKLPYEEWTPPKPLTKSEIGMDRMS